MQPSNIVSGLRHHRRRRGLAAIAWCLRALPAGCAADRAGAGRRPVIDLLNGLASERRIASFPTFGTPAPKAYTPLQRLEWATR